MVDVDDMMTIAIGKQVAAEGTLKQQEAPLIKKCERRSGVLAVAWQDAFTMARQWHNAFADPSKTDWIALDETARFEVEWEAFYLESAQDDQFEAETDLIKINQVVAKLSAGFISKKQGALELGYSEEQIAAMQDDITAEASTVSALAPLFNKGSTGI